MARGWFTQRNVTTQEAILRPDAAAQFEHMAIYAVSPDAPLLDETNFRRQFSRLPSIQVRINLTSARFLACSVPRHHAKGSTRMSPQEFLTWSEGTHEIGKRTGKYHSPHNVANACRRLNLVAIDDNGREGLSPATAAKLARLWLATGYFTPRPGHGDLTAA